MDTEKYAEELANTLYEALTSNQDGVLPFNQVVDILLSRTEFGLRKIEGAGVKRFKEKYPNVIQENDDKGLVCYRLLNDSFAEIKK